jgi:subtilisin family serine protease
MSMGMQPLQFSAVEQSLRASPDIEILDTVGPKNIVGMLADGMAEAPSVLVARMTEEKAGILHQQAQGRLIIERDQALTLHDAGSMQPMFVGGTSISAGAVLAAVFTILGKDNAPLKDAEVYLFGSMLPATGVTDERGEVTLTLFGETPQSIRGLYVKPKCDYWSFYQQQPDISTDEANIVGMRPLSDWPGLAGFPQQQILGWGQKAMRLDQLPGNYRGQGIKVAIIDSGAATTHEDLKKIRFGFDIIDKKTNPDGWTEDSISHGSHCAGIIAGADNAFGVRGFAPDAEVHICKLFPGGQVSQLIDALEYCIEKQIDVANLSLGGIEPSEALEQQIQRAKRAGVACIVAAGNSGGRVQYPASSPNVLAVSAIGRLNEFPSDSYHTQTVTPAMDANGFFAARFSCFGPEIGVCAPGVAITSSVPPNNFAVWDGTSMAAPHVTGLAALVLAHHPDFQSTFKTRGPERVERLIQIIKASARPVNLGDVSRTGFGLPDVMVAIGLQTATGQPIATASAGSTAQPAAFHAGHAAIGSMTPQQAFAYGTQYAEQSQLSPQAWVGSGGNSWPHSLGVLMAAVDPYAAYFGRQSFGNMMPGVAYGMNSGPGGFPRQGW